MGRGLRKKTEQRAATDDAIQHIGTNALTFLLQWIRYQPSSWRYNLYNSANDALDLLNRNWEIEDREETRAAGAIKAFGALRPQVERAIPESAQSSTTERHKMVRVERRQSWEGLEMPGCWSF